MKFAAVVVAFLSFCQTPLFAAAAGLLQGRPVAWGNAFQTNVPANLTNVVAVAAGSYHSLALRTDGTVVAWGTVFTPVPTGLTGIVAIAGGFQHSMVLRSNGTVFVWGDNSGGQTNVPPNLTGVKAIAAGDYHCLALTSNGTVVAWGANGGVQTQVPPAALSGVEAIAAGGSHSLALKSGFVFGWGQNTSGQLPDSPLNGFTAIAAGANFSLAVRNGYVFGWGSDYSGQISPPLTLNGVYAVAAGSSHSVALRTNGVVVCWGDNTSGQTNVPAGIPYSAMIGAGYGHTIALRVDPPGIVAQPESRTVPAGTNVTFSIMATGSPPIFYQWLKDGSSINGATNSSYSINSAQAAHEGIYAVWVGNYIGSLLSSNATLTVNTPPYIFTQPTGADVAAGSPVNIAVVALGSPTLRFQWRLNNTNIQGATAANYFIPSAQFTNAGSYRVVVTNQFGAVTSSVAVLTVNPLPSITVPPQSQSVVAGSSVTLSVTALDALTYQWQKDGQPIAGATSSSLIFGSVQSSNAGAYTVAISNDYGGVVSSPAVLSVTTPPDGTNTFIVTWGERWPWNGSTYVDLAAPPGLVDVTALASGMWHSLALRVNGGVTGWGDNSFGQASPSIPLANVIQLAAGAYHSLARKQDGTVECWGRNDFGQTAVPSGLSNILMIAGGGYHSLALRNDGTVTGWGKNHAGQLIPPPSVGNSNFMAIAAGLEFSLALRSNGIVYAWGTNDAGQARPPAGLDNVMKIAAGERHSLALKSNGLVVAWGDNSHGQTNLPTGLSNVADIACGANHCLALRQDGTVFAWGQNNWEQTQLPPELKAAFFIAAGGSHSLALRATRLRFQTINRPTNGISRVTLGYADGSSIAPDKVEKIDIQSSTSTSLADSWVPWPGPVYLSNGRLVLDVPVTNAVQRLLRATEHP